MKEHIRYKLIIEYDGSDFAGWQFQKGLASVQGTLEDALFKLTSRKTSVIGAGRTDAGVSALGQVAHFDLLDDGKIKNTQKLRESINFFVKPHKVVILQADIAENDFHARFSAKSRRYVYRIINRPAPSVIIGEKAWHIKEELDVDAMHEAAQVLIGKHDFTAFCNIRCQSKSKIKTLSSIRVIKSDMMIGAGTEYSQKIIEIWLEAPSFLHNQVRIIVGNLRKVGTHQMTKDKLLEILMSKDRQEGAETAPPEGLFLYDVRY